MRSLGRATSLSSGSQHIPYERERESINLHKVDEEVYEGYKSCDGNDNGPMLNENDDCILLGLHCIAFVRQIIT